MTLLEAGNDVAVIGLFLGHKKLGSTQVYLHGDMAIKERAMDRTAALRGDRQRRYRPPDALLAFLESL
jgi:integrase/recombinase XerD